MALHGEGNARREGDPRPLLSRTPPARLTCRLLCSTASTLPRPSRCSVRTGSRMRGPGCHPACCALDSCGGEREGGGRAEVFASGQQRVHRRPGRAGDEAVPCCSFRTAALRGALGRWRAIHVRSWLLEAGRWSQGCGGRSSRRTSASDGGCAAEPRASLGAAWRPPRPTARAILPPSLTIASRRRCTGAGCRPGQGGLRAAAVGVDHDWKPPERLKRRAGSYIAMHWASRLAASKSSCAVARRVQVHPHRLPADMDGVADQLLAAHEQATCCSCPASAPCLPAPPASLLPDTPQRNPPHNPGSQVGGGGAAVAAAVATKVDHARSVLQRLLRHASPPRVRAAARADGQSTVRM